MFSKKSCSSKFRNIHGKIPVLESLFNRFPGLFHANFILHRSSNRRYSIKRVLLKISQYLQKSICIGVFFNKVRPATLSKRDSNTGVFLQIFIAEYLRTSILKIICERLLLFHTNFTF